MAAGILITTAKEGTAPNQTIPKTSTGLGAVPVIDDRTISRLAGDLDRAKVIIARRPAGDPVAN